MLSAEEAHSQELAAVVLARLSRQNAIVQVKISEAGGIEPLVRLIREGPSNIAQLQAAAAIAEVAHVPATRDAIAEAGGIEPLVTCLSSTVAGTPETAALALARLARDDVDSGEDGGAEPEGEPPAVPIEKPGAVRRASIKAAGGVTKLVSMLEQRSFPGMAKQMWKMVAIVMGIQNLTEDDVRVKEHMNIGVQEQVAATICDLTYGDVTMQDTVIEEQGIPELLGLLRLGSQLGQEYAARALWHLCASVHNQGTVVDEGSIVELVALSRIGSEKAQELAAAVISSLASGAIVERERKQKEAAAARAAAGIDADAPAEAEPEQPEAAPATDEAGMPVVKVARGDRLAAIAAAGGIVPLVGLLSVGSLMGKERAAGALWHLSVDAVNRMIIAKAGGIAPLVQLLDDGTLQAHIHVAVALGRLAMNNPDNQAQIAKKLVGLVGLKNRPGAQQRAAHTLWELAQNNPGAPVIIVNAGAISPLVTLLSTGVSEAKKEAAGALDARLQQSVQPARDRNGSGRVARYG